MLDPQVFPQRTQAVEDHFLPGVGVDGQRTADLREIREAAEVVQLGVVRQLHVAVDDREGSERGEVGEGGGVDAQGPGDLPVAALDERCEIVSLEVHDDVPLPDRLGSDGGVLVVTVATVAHPRPPDLAARLGKGGVAVPVTVGVGVGQRAVLSRGVAVLPTAHPKRSPQPHHPIHPHLLAPRYHGLHVALSGGHGHPVYTAGGPTYRERALTGRTRDRSATTRGPAPVPRPSAPPQGAPSRPRAQPRCRQRRRRPIEGVEVHAGGCAVAVGGVWTVAAGAVLSHGPVAFAPSSSASAFRGKRPVARARGRSGAAGSVRRPPGPDRSALPAGSVRCGVVVGSGRARPTRPNAGRSAAGWVERRSPSAAHRTLPHAGSEVDLAPRWGGIVHEPVVAG